jgi:hypothetical protein
LLHRVPSTTTVDPVFKSIQTGKLGNAGYAMSAETFSVF